MIRSIFPKKSFQIQHLVSRDTFGEGVVGTLVDVFQKFWKLVDVFFPNWVFFEIFEMCLPTMQWSKCVNFDTIFISIIENFYQIDIQF